MCFTRKTVDGNRTPGTANRSVKFGCAATALGVASHSSEPHHHLATRLARFHQLVRFSDFLEAKYAPRFCFVTAVDNIIRDGLERDIR
jgi:hypothetical protein